MILASLVNRVNIALGEPVGFVEFGGLDWLGKSVGSVESGGPGDFGNCEVILMVLLDLVNLVVLMNLLILVILPGILNIWVVFFDLCECS